jgi:predicted nucleotide-binding protein
MPIPADDPALQTEMLAFKKMPSEPGTAGAMKPRVFISNSNTKVADQVKRMLDFLHYDYVMGDKEQTTVPIPESKFNVMKNCDCAVINIAAAEQERRYSGIYVLNSNVISEINAAYLKYNTQVILLVERKIELPPNLKGLKRIEYDSDDLSFNAAMDLNKALADFGKI